MKRAHISLKTKLAATLLNMLRSERTFAGEVWVPIIPHEEAKTLTADEIIARFHFDHYPIPHAQGGPDEPWNLTPMPTFDHKEKTAKIDVPQIAKTKRVTKNYIEHTRTMNTPRDERPARKSRFKSRPFPRRKKP
jgi:hypothetical protein